MLQDPRTVELVLIALLLAVLVLAVALALLYRSQTMLRRRLRRLLADGEGMGLDAIAADLEKVDRLGERVDALNALQRDLERTGQHAVQRTGVVRFNPFTDTGGDQSFAIALLDALGNGLVISSLHGRADTRVFAKPVRGGRSKHQLSTEEEEAIRQALAPAEA